MEILGIGPLEFIFIIIIALIILGPNDMIKAGRTLGSFLRKLILSPEWRTIQQASKEMRNLPNRMIREAGLEDMKDQLPTMDQLRQEAGLDKLEESVQDIQKGLQTDISPWTTPTPTIGTPNKPLESKKTPKLKPGQESWATPPPAVEKPPEAAAAPAPSDASQASVPVPQDGKPVASQADQQEAE
jgi:hypothetical protein